MVEETKHNQYTPLEEKKSHFVVCFNTKSNIKTAN